MTDCVGAGDDADVIGSSSTSARQREVNERLDERHRERLAAQAQRRTERAAGVVDAERSDHFWTSLDAEEAAARAGLDLLTGGGGAADRLAVGDALDAASRRLQSIHKFIADSAVFLPAYDLRRAQLRASQLQDLIQQRQQQLVPRQKFGFRGRHKARKTEIAAGKLETKLLEAGEAPVTVCADADTAPVSAAAVVSMSVADECGFRDRSDATLRLSGAAVRGRDVALTGLTRCIVRVTGAPATVHMSGLRQCRVLLGPVATSVFVEDCVGCTLAAACQQLRAHTSADCDVYLHVTSRAVIEHCQRLRFAPYDVAGQELELDWATTALSRDRNNWHDVDDFNWLSKAKRSPHWGVLPQEERRTNGGQESENREDSAAV